MQVEVQVQVEAQVQVQVQLQVQVQSELEGCFWSSLWTLEVQKNKWYIDLISADDGSRKPVDLERTLSAP